MLFSAVITQKADKKLKPGCIITNGRLNGGFRLVKLKISGELRRKCLSVFN